MLGWFIHIQFFKFLFFAIDIYHNDTIKQADMGLVLRPGTDGALAAGVMHILFRDGLADRDYLAKYADDPAGLEAHLATKTPEWAAAITGLTVDEITSFAHLVGNTKRTFFRLGYGFACQRNGENQSAENRNVNRGLK